MISQILLAKIVLASIQILFIVRFHLEISKVNSFMEPVNTIRRITNPVVLPLKSILPGVWPKRCAALIVGFVMSIVAALVLLQSGFYAAFANALLYFVSNWIDFLRYGMFFYVIGTWIQIDSFKRVNYILYHVFEPLLRPIKSVVPSFAGFDFSAIIFLLGLSLISPYVFSFLFMVLG